jgi:drug/metabolite transporter (DMT)-like permease
MDKIALAAVFCVLGVIFFSAAIYYVQYNPQADPTHQTGYACLALGALFLCLFAIFLWWGITELKVELAKLQLKSR